MSPRPAVGASRAERILDAAGDLLLRHGYRKVTIGDIAEHARIGKGTVYLHWRTKEELFQALLLRESIGLTEALIAQVRADPALIVPHRLLRGMFLTVRRQPLVMAMVVGDADVLGALLDSPLHAQEVLTTDRFFSVLIRHGLLRADVPDLDYALRAASAGFYLLDQTDPTVAGLPAEAKADALAHTIRHAFEPEEPAGASAVHAAADEVIALFEDLISGYRKWIHPMMEGKQP